MINALKYTEDLEKAGFSPEQARVSVNAWMDLMNNNFATKSDLKEYQFMTRADLKDFEMKLSAGLAGVEQKFDKRCDEIEQKLDKRCDAIEQRLEKLELSLIIKMSTVMILISGFALTLHRLL